MLPVFHHEVIDIANRGNSHLRRCRRTCLVYGSILVNKRRCDRVGLVKVLFVETCHNLSQCVEAFGAQEFYQHFVNLLLSPVFL